MNNIKLEKKIDLLAELSIYRGTIAGEYSGLKVPKYSKTVGLEPVDRIEVASID